MRVAVVGHVEWVEFLRVDHIPRPGEIIQGTATVSVPAGGGGVAAVQLARWGAETHLFTALGDDELGRRAAGELRARGVTVHVATRAELQRRAITLVDAARERTIILAGQRHVPHGDDVLPWDVLATCDAVYLTGGDAAAVRHARSARVVVSTARVLALLRDAAIELDALVGSDDDPAEAYAAGDLTPAPRLVVRTDGARGGTFAMAGDEPQRYAATPATVTGDTYGAGDTFAAALTFGLGEGRTAADAIERAAGRAAEVLAYDGPYPPGVRSGGSAG